MGPSRTTCPCRHTKESLRRTLRRQPSLTGNYSGVNSPVHRSILCISDRATWGGVAVSSSVQSLFTSALPPRHNRSLALVSVAGCFELPFAVQWRHLSTRARLSPDSFTRDESGLDATLICRHGPVGRATPLSAPVAGRSNPPRLFARQRFAREEGVPRGTCR